MTELEKRFADILEQIGDGLPLAPESQGWKDGCWCRHGVSSRYHTIPCERANILLKEYYRQLEQEQPKAHY